VKTFILMTKFSGKDAGLVEVGSKLQGRARMGRSWIDHIKATCPKVKFLAHYALLGHWDFMDIYEAPDEETAAKVSLIVRSGGAHQVESWLAIPYEKVVKLLSEDIEDSDLRDKP